MVPKVVLMKSGLVSVNTTRQVNIAHTKTTVNGASPMSNLSKIAHSTVKRPTNNNIAFKYSNQRVNTVRGNNVNITRPKVVVNAVKGNHVNAVKASACWVWKPKTKVLDYGNPQQDLQEKGVIDSGCSRYMTWNKSYLTNFEEIDGGYVAFGGNPKGGKITSRATKDETSGILKSFITRVENLIDQRVNVIRCDNGIEFKNKEMNSFCERKGVKREFSVARTPQQNGVDERKNRTLIEAARTMLADSKLPTTFWAEAVNTGCYMQNRVLVTKPHNKTPYERFLGRKPALGFMRPFGCPVTILNTIDHLGKFDGKADEGFFVGYSINSKAFRCKGYNGDSTGNITFATIVAVIYHSLKIQEMDVKSAFLYGKIEEEVYVCQPPGFEDPDFPDRVYKVKNALFGLHQAPKAWYETLLTYLLDNGFQRGKIDKTLFIRREKGLQVNQKEDGIFISQDKYVTEILKKFGFTNVKTASTPMETQKLLLKDEDGEEVDVDLYRSIIGSMMYLTSSRPNIIFAVCACAKYQVNPKVSHLHDVKRIFRYYEREYASASLDRKSTTGVLSNSWKWINIKAYARNKPWLKFHKEVNM
ncbi:ribonuclease H-like domain-containing protein [Tanacetum coccineum]